MKMTSSLLQSAHKVKAVSGVLFLGGGATEAAFFIPHLKLVCQISEASVRCKDNNNN